MFTVFGASGYIGSQMVRHLAAQGDDVATPARGAAAMRGEMGHVIYAIGLTADFRTRPFETMEAHVSYLAEVLQSERFESFLYLSSTRVYARAARAEETEEIAVDPADASDLYNISKLAGESLCLTRPEATVRVARLANVFGGAMDGTVPSANFLPTVVREAACDGRVRLGTALASAKDYIAIEDVTRALRRIALSGRHRLYNVASGQNVTNAAIAAELQRLCGCEVEVPPDAPVRAFPRIDTTRLAAEFTPPDPPWAPASVLGRLPDIVNQVRRQQAAATGASA